MKDPDPVHPEDRRIITALEQAIADPATPENLRTEYREELGSIAFGYVGMEWLTDEERKEIFAEKDRRIAARTAERGTAES